ncbi:MULTISPECIES: alpha/beta fold hydrolase [Myxococcaceae]|uniref:alpha/beta fold hydrolase n=1 Tax=Myxococcaceae TaxID=31 RepID=UPI0018904F16|nr:MULTISPECIES: alpha/beta hydrolase [Myxococcaceae]MBF5045094.1 alpha/beta hydrolase [Simulacricoccus sp. 17bor-14]
MVRALHVPGLLLLLCACAHAPAAPPALQQGSHEQVLNGVRLYYRVAGSGPAQRPPVLFLHGGPGYNSESFARLAGVRLERSAQWIYLDQRGCGRSERPWTGDYALATLVEDLEALRRSLGVPRWVLMGHSFGGALALEYAARHPEAVAGLIVVDGLWDGPGSYASWAQTLEEWYPGRLAKAPPADSDFTRVTTALQGLDAKAFFDRMQWHQPARLAEMERVDAQSGLRNTGELSRALFAGELLHYRFGAAERIQAPALVIIGQHDRAIGPQTARALAQALPHATLREYAQSAHFPYLEEPERFERDVTTFLAHLP